MPPDNPFQRPKKYTFRCDGVDVNTPGDEPKNAGKASRLLNMTVDIDGTLTPRPGVVNRYASALIASKTPVHSIRRISDSSDSSWAMLYGTGDRLASELSTSAGTINNEDGPYSGNPMSIIPWRPNQTQDPYAYVYDSLRQRKISVDGTVKTIGIAAPTVPPTVELGKRLWSEIGDFESVVGYTADNTVVMNADIALLAGDRVNTTITRHLFDSGSSGWGCYQPASLTNIGPGSILFLQAGLDNDTVFVAEVYRASSATTIASIVYDSGSTGACTIQPVAPVKEIQRNALIQVNSGGSAEFVRIISVVPGPDDTSSFRCVLAGTHAAADNLQVLGSFRAYTVAANFAGATCTQRAIQFSNVTSGVKGIGYIQAAATSFDLTKMSGLTGYGGAITDEEYFHISLRCSNWQNVTMVRVLFSLDATAFTDNYFYRAIEQSALVAAAKGTQRPRQIQRRRLQDYLTDRPLPEDRQRMDRRAGETSTGRGDPLRSQDSGLFADQPRKNPTPEAGSPSNTTPSNETGTGDNQWSEIRWKRGEMFRVGSDLSRGWQDVTRIRIEVTFASTGATTIIVNSLNVYGGSAPDIGDAGLPYQYRYRYRDSSTGAVSAYSPASLSGVYAFRDQVLVTASSTVGTDADKIDIERFGGLQGGWCYVGTIDNAVTPFTDKIGDIAAIRNAVVSDRQIAQPWVRTLSPISGTATTIAGTAIDDNGSNPIPDGLVPGTLVIINGTATTFRRYLGLSGATHDRWEVADSIGSGSTVKWEIPEPRVAGQPIARVFGPYQGSMLACDGQYLRWTDGNDPDVSSDIHYTEITDPSDPLVGGFMYNGRAAAWSTRRLFWINGDPVHGFTGTEVPNGKGLFGPYSFAVGYRIAWLSRDGIYESQGGEPVNITTEDLAPLFPQEGRAGQDANGLKAPLLTVAEWPYLRLAYADDDSLLFSYRDSLGARHTLRYMHDRKRWLPYDYAVAVNMFYSLEGDGVRGLVAGGGDTTSAKVYTVGGSTDPTTDDTTGFNWLYRSFSDDLGDPRSRKYLGDMTVDVDPANTTVTATLGTDNFSTSTALGSITGAARTTKLFDLSSGNGIRARNYGIELTGTTSTGNRPRLHNWQMALLPRPETISLRASDYELGGSDGDKYMQGIIIDADTFNVAKTLRIEYDGGQLGDTVTITHNGRRRESYSFAIPFTARLVRLATADADTWELYDYRYVFNPEPPAAKVWQIQFSGFDIPGYKHIQQFRPAYAAPAAVTVELYKDQGTLAATLTLPSTGGAGYADVERPTFYVPAFKFKLGYMKLSCASDWRLYLRDTEILMKGWGETGDYHIIRPAGDDHRTTGARI